MENQQRKITKQRNKDNLRHKIELEKILASEHFQTLFA